LDSEKLVIRSKEAEDVVTLIEDEGDEEDVLNQVSGPLAYSISTLLTVSRSQPSKI
jgi:hypothetical protein